jgi:hypothetical protein
VGIYFYPDLKCSIDEYDSETLGSYYDSLHHHPFDHNIIGNRGIYIDQPRAKRLELPSKHIHLKLVQRLVVIVGVWLRIFGIYQKFVLNRTKKLNSTEYQCYPEMNKNQNQIFTLIQDMNQKLDYGDN